MISPKEEMGILEHLTELRRRLFVILASIAIASIIGWFLSNPVFVFLIRPFELSFPKGILMGTSPAEAFLIKLKVAVFVGFIISTPVILWQIWRFLEPGLYDKEKRLAIPFVLCASLLFLGGVLFSYYLILPVAFNFFQEQYTSISLVPNILIGEHISTVLTCLISFGVVFQMPVIVAVLARANIIGPMTLIHWWRHAIVGIFVVAAVLTPPDVFSQFLMAGPLILLYGISIGVAKLARR